MAAFRTRAGRPAPLEVDISTELWQVVLYGSVAGTATLGGILAVLHDERWAMRHAPHLLAFAAGVLTTGALLPVAGRAIRAAGTRAGLLALAVSFAAAATLQLVLLRRRHGAGPDRTRAPGAASPAPGAAETRREVSLGTMAPLELFIHSGLDGIALSVAVLTGGPAWPLLVLVVAHEGPEGIASASAQLHAGRSRRTTLWRSVAIALATPVGAIASYLLLRGAGGTLLGVLMGVAGGAFLHAGATNLLPESGGGRSRAPVLLFIAGAAVILGLEALRTAAGP